MNAKMNETLKVAQHKVQCTLEQEKKIQTEIDEKRAFQNGINTEIDEMKEKDMRDVDEFQVKLSDLAKMFINARKFYTPENLEKELKTLEKKQGAVLNEREKCEIETKAMIDQMEQMKLDRDAVTERANQLAIPAEQQKMIINDMDACIKSINESVHAMKEKQKMVKDKIKQIKTKLKDD